MFEWINQFLSQNQGFVNGALTAFGAVGTFITIRGVWRSNKRQIYFDNIRKVHIKKLDDDYPSITVGDGEAIGSSLIEDIYFISNRTEVTLTDDDFVAPMTIRRANNSLIYSASQIALEGSNSVVLTDTVEGLQLLNVRIERNSSLTIRIMHDSALIDDISATTKSLLGPKRKKYSDELAMQVILFSLFSLFMWIFTNDAIELSAFGIEFSLLWLFVFPIVILGYFFYQDERQPEQGKDHFILGRLYNKIMSRTRSESIFAHRRAATLMAIDIPREIEIVSGNTLTENRKSKNT